MYINFEYSSKKSLSNNHVLCLIMTHQNSNGSHEEFLKTIPDQVFVDLNNEGYFTVIKGKKGQSKRNKLRLSKKGKDLILMLSTPEACDGDSLIYNFLESVYNKLDKKVSSKPKMLRLIALFRSNAGFSVDQLYKLIKKYVNSDEMDYNFKMEFLIFRANHAYEKFTLNSSRLYDFYLQNGID